MENIGLREEQDWMRLYIEDPYSTSTINRIIRGKVYHKEFKGKPGLLFTFNANFDNAFYKEGKNYLYINSGDKTQYYETPFSDNPKDVDITFDFNTESETTTGEFLFHNGTKKLSEINIIKVDERTRNVFFSNEATGLTGKETIGFAFGYNGDSLNDDKQKHCYPFGNPVHRKNQFGYARLYPNDSCYGSSHNINELGITYDNIPSNFISYEVPGIIGLPSVGGYNVKIAKNKNDDNGIYILTMAYHRWEYTRFYCRYNYNRHFFINTDAEEYKHDDVEGYNLVYNFVSEGNYWMSRFICENSKSATPEATKVKLDSLLNEGIKYYSKGSEYDFFIPYSYLTKLNPKFTKDSNIGFMFNIYQGINGVPYGWENWTLPKKNPTGYNQTMFYENRKSYLHLDSNLNVVPFK